MYDLILLSILTLPLLAVSLAGRHFELGLPGAAPEVLAKRRYQLSWLISMADDRGSCCVLSLSLLPLG